MGNQNVQTFRQAVDASIVQEIRSLVETVQPPASSLPMFVDAEGDIVDGEIYALRARVLADGRVVFSPARGPRLAVKSRSLVAYGTDRKPELVPIGGQATSDLLAADTAAAQLSALDAGRSTLAITATGNFALTLRPFHNFITVALNANSTITEISGLRPGDTIQMLVTNAGAFTLSKSAGALQLWGSDGLTVASGAGVKSLLMLTCFGSGSYAVKNANFSPV